MHAVSFSRLWGESSNFERKFGTFRTLTLFPFVYSAFQFDDTTRTVLMCCHKTN